MSRETRTPLIRVIVIVAAIFFATGLVGHLIHKLDFPSALLLMFGFAAFSGGITWLTIWDDRQTREQLERITTRLEPFGMEIHPCKGGWYTVSSDGLFDNFIVAEELDLNELEAWIQGLQTGIGLEEAKHHHEETEAVSS